MRKVGLTPVGGFPWRFTTIDASFMRVVFIDFDGVLHAASAATGLKRSVITSSSHAEMRARGLFVFAPVLAASLRQAYDTEELRVVAHSSWRAHFRDDEIRALLPELEPWLLGTVGFPTLGRDSAITKWLELMADRITDYLVLDDVPQLFSGGEDKWANMVVCESEKGIDDPRVQDEIKKFLTGRRKREREDLGAIDFEAVDLEALKASLKR
jgi:hypothetical protein